MRLNALNKSCLSLIMIAVFFQVIRTTNTTAVEKRLAMTTTTVIKNFTRTTQAPSNNVAQAVNSEPSTDTAIQ